ncbi:energy transducer TonB [Zhongshania sp.]|jgi:protein TonB|uniref:energy transducer TonB n=1 Tax=Zhongshania sp. TaxID=1971902 RepID=UPI001B4DBDC8|nr:energy transducer TonB [Zhongshania sp.]MBQ0797517.1 energy transducer TonB [Zhongshania sp.]
MTAATLPMTDDHTPPERLGFIIVVATAMHLALILGITFAAPEPSVKLPNLEITLAQYQSKDAPENADYLAQYDQIGSGSLKDKAELSATSESAFHDNTAKEEEALKLAKSVPDTAGSALLSTTGDATRSTKPQQTRMLHQQQQWDGSDAQNQLSENISALEAQLENLNQSYARMPRPKFITSVATKGSPDALYLNRWEKRVETVGNANYPEEARRLGIEGELRLLLMLMPDGRIDEVRILSSSGNPILDRAAHRIVRLAAPYEAIPSDVLDGKNRLGIVRTWRFERQSLKTNQG